MIPTPHVDWFALSPSLSLLAAAGLLLLVAVFVPSTSRRSVAAFVGLAGFVTSLALAIAVAEKTPVGTTIIADSVYRDRWAAVAQVLIATSGAIAVLVSYAERMRDEHIAEYYALLTAAGGGMAFFVSSARVLRAADGSRGLIG